MKVVSSRSAERDILSSEKNLALRIGQKITALGKNPFPPGFEKLSGNKGYRIRIGDYRVVYLIDKKLKTISVIKVKHRKEVYR